MDQLQVVDGIVNTLEASTGTAQGRYNALLRLIREYSNLKPTQKQQFTMRVDKLCKSCTRAFLGYERNLEDLTKG